MKNLFTIGILFTLLTFASMGTLLREKTPDLNIEEYTMNVSNKMNMSSLNYYPTNNDSRLIKIIKYGFIGLTGIFVEGGLASVEYGFNHPHNYLLLAYIIIFSITTIYLFPYIALFVLLGYNCLNSLYHKYWRKKNEKISTL